MLRRGDRGYLETPHDDDSRSAGADVLGGPWTAQLSATKQRRRNVPELLRSILIRQRIAAVAAGQDINDPPLCYFYDQLPLPVLTP